MANTLKKRSYFIDTIGTCTVTALSPIILGLMITPSAVDSRIVIKESVSGTVVVDVKVESIETRFLTFEAFGGIVVTQNFEIAELTNISSVILYGLWYMPVNQGSPT